MKKLYPLAALCALLFLLLSSTASAQRMRKSDLESGMMEKGKKVGVWEYFSFTRDGRQVLVQRYDHTTNKLVFYRPIEDIAYETEVRPGQWTRTRLEQPPLFVGGEGALSGYMGKLSYPTQAQSRNIQGRVLVSFAIDTLGRASGHKVLMGIGGGCDEEALRLCRTIPPLWIPARLGGHAVPVVYELPFTFRLAQP
jgi:periplasmic protein TonB